MLAREKLWNLRPLADDSLVGSLVWQRFVPESQYIHEHGCRIAALRNSDAQNKRRQVYCGAYQLFARAVRGLASDELSGVLSADVEHKIENDELAHVEVKICLKHENFDVEATKTAIIDRLWSACSGPLNHVCQSDEDLAPHPNQNLLVPLRGPFVDSRSWFSRKWSLVRFKMYVRLWNSNLKVYMFRRNRASG